MAALGLVAMLVVAPVAFGATASWSLSPSNYDFGRVQPASVDPATPAIFTLTNTGEADLAAPRVRLEFEMVEGLELELFEVAPENDCEDRVSFLSGETCKVEVTFRPLYPGPRSGTITFTDPNGQVAPATASFEGVGIGPIARLSSPLSIGSYLLGIGQSPPTVFSLANIGDADLEIGAISLRELGTNPNQVAVVGGTCSVGEAVAPDGSCTIQVAFTPTQEEEFSGQLRVDDNAAHGFQEVPIRGAGVGFPPEPPLPRFVRILSRPRPTTRRHTARFRFDVEGGGVPFVCKLDRGRFRPCRSPRTYRHLGSGLHTFRVKPRIHMDGLWSGLAKARFRVLPRKPHRTRGSWPPKRGQGPAVPQR